MLAALGLRVEEAQLPERAPIAIARGRILVSFGASVTLRALLELAGLALASLRFEASAHSMSDIWLVVALLDAR